MAVFGRWPLTSIPFGPPPEDRCFVNARKLRFRPLNYLSHPPPKNVVLVLRIFERAICPNYPNKQTPIDLSPSIPKTNAISWMGFVHDGGAFRLSTTPRGFPIPVAMAFVFPMCGGRKSGPWKFRRGSVFPCHMRIISLNLAKSS